MRRHHCLHEIISSSYQPISTALTHTHYLFSLHHRSTPSLANMSFQGDLQAATSEALHSSKLLAVFLRDNSSVSNLWQTQFLADKQVCLHECSSELPSNDVLRLPELWMRPLSSSMWRKTLRMLLTWLLHTRQIKCKDCIESKHRCNVDAAPTLMPSVIATARSSNDAEFARAFNRWNRQKSKWIFATLIIRLCSKKLLWQRLQKSGPFWNQKVGERLASVLLSGLILLIIARRLYDISFLSSLKV